MADKKSFSERVRSSADSNKREVDDWLQGPGAIVFGLIAVALIVWFIATNVFGF